MYPHPKHLRHRPSSSRSWIRTSLVGRIPILVLEIDSIHVCIEEDAFNILRSATPEQEDTKEVKLEYLKPALCISVKTETPGVKTEEDDAQHTSGPGSSSGTPFVLAFVPTSAPGCVYRIQTISSPHRRFRYPSAT